MGHANTPPNRMLTYTPPSEQDLPKATEKPWLLLLLCLAWLLPGLIGREPLKPDETVIADIVRHMLSGGSLLVPTIPGGAFVEHPPLFYWVASAFAWVGQWLGLPLHDGARLASAAFMALALWGTGLTGRLLIGRRHGRSAVLILIGCVGLLLPGHTLTTDTAVLAGWSLGLLALVIARKQAVAGGLFLGLTMAVSGLAGSLVEPTLLLVLALILLRFPAWQGNRYGVTLMAAVGIGLPLILSWPLALGQTDPQAFSIWWGNYALGWFGGFGAFDFSHPFGYYLKLLPWFAWPAWPLAAATLLMQRDRLAQPMFQLPIAASVLVLIGLCLAQSQRAGDALILLPPLAIIGAVGLDVLRRGASAFLNWFGVMALGLLAAFIWTIGLAMQVGIPVRLAQRIRELNPGFEQGISWAAMAFALFFTLVWIWAVSRRRQMGRQAVTNWAAGVTLCWGLFTAFGTDWINRYNGYRGFSETLHAALPAQPGCVIDDSLGPSQRAVVHYYLGLELVARDGPEAQQCAWRLRQSGRDAPPEPKGWKAVWEGGRAGDNTERYQLFTRKQ